MTHHQDNQNIASRANPHQSLQGRERLASVVYHLGEYCPWTAAVDTQTMLSWLASEISELRRELVDHHSLAPNRKNRAEIVSELGDILFDSLMLELLCKRDFTLTDNEAWEAAAEKVERRTQYISAWGDGSVARTAEEARALWQAAKAKSPRQIMKRRNNQT